MAAYIPESPTGANHATAKYPVGNVYFDYDGDEGLRFWMYVNNDGAIDTIAGHTANPTDTRGYVSSDRNSPSATYAAMGCGIFRSAITTQYYGFLQISGYVDNEAHHSSLAPGEVGMSHSTDGQLVVHAGEAHGMFLCTDTGDTYASGYIVGCM